MLNKKKGLIIYVKKIKDNDLFIKLLSSDDNIISGIVYGGNSSKKRSIYQNGFFIEFNLIQKNINSVKSINGELTPPFTGSIFFDKFKSFSLLSLISILNESIYQDAKIHDLFLSVKELIISINSNKSWLSTYCKWLLDFLKLLGYEIEYKNIDNKYFNLQTLNFENQSNNNDLLRFPYELFEKNYVINSESVSSLFTIFETVYKKNNLNNYKETMPINYINFKNLILDKLSNL
tara:strand:- start:220 stop:921 length:702 start_codon:yes stop_codon:yes gene_type:complete